AGEGGSIDAAEILKPMLARGQLQTIGATTIGEYKIIEKDPALERRFQPITIKEPTIEQAIMIIKGIKSKYEAHHGVVVTDEAITSAVNLSKRYITERFLPDKAVDLIDEACSRAKLQAGYTPKSLELKVRKLKNLQIEIEKANAEHRFLDVDDIRLQFDRLRVQAEDEKSRFLAERDNSALQVTANDIAEVVSKWTGVPVDKISVKDADKLLNLENILKMRVIGQDEAVRAVARAIRRARAGLKDPTKPIGSFIFVGPTGVGKTELSKALAEAVFDDSNATIRFDMSEFMEKNSVSKLIGAPPGYAGYEENGQLTEKVRRNPYSVVLFDEIEKAHPDVFNLLLQVLDEGRLTDAKGKIADFRNTVIIMTSNIGSGEVSASHKVGFGASSSYLSDKERTTNALKGFFRPEFLNRIDDIIVFEPLTESEIRQIAKILTDKLKLRLADFATLNFTSDALDLLAHRGYDREYGARPLKRVIEREVEDSLSDKILHGEVVKGGCVTIDAKNGEIVFLR
ncbi:MAG: ATP-dependent Clp protease ATP-binding subunit, partial [Clostridia bacterium]